MSTADRPRLAVVIPTFDSECWIVDTLTSAVAATDGVMADGRVSIGSAAVIVVDDGSTVPTQALLHGALLNDEFAERVKIVRTDVNRGQHAATLTGVDAAVHNGADCIVTVDDDVLFGTDALANLLLASGWGTGAANEPALAYGVVRQASAARRVASRAARTLIRWRPEWVATSIRSIPASWCVGLDDRPIDTQLLGRGADGTREVAVLVAFESHGHPSARSRYGIVGLLRHAGNYVRSWLGAGRQ